MSISASSVVIAPVADVYAWHERPGALTRLTPPWQPVRVRHEATDLCNGRAELALPGPLTWTAQHKGCHPPYGFKDELTSLPLPWRHEHRFEPMGDDRTRVTDCVDTPVPERLLRATFAYRHRQLAAELAAHAAARQVNPARLTVAMTGSSGFIGTALSAFLTSGGHRVIRLVRRPATGPDERGWQPDAPAPELLQGVDAVVHLAGSSIAGRFTPGHKREVFESRIGPTRALAQLATSTSGGPRVFVSASAIGYYGSERGEKVLGEDAARGRGFLAHVVADWEAATTPATEGGLRVVVVRTGVVLSPRGGVLALLYPLFWAGLGGTVGDGSAWLSWVGLDDLVDIYLRALLDESLAGPVNAVAPNPVRWRTFTQVLGRTLHRPAVVPVPPLAAALALGREGAREVALASQRVSPSRLAAVGHTFRHGAVDLALEHQLGKAGFPQG
jgi:uncharacterized protein